MFKSTKQFAIITSAAFLLAGGPASAAISNYSQDFEGLTVADFVNDNSDLDNDGWEVTGNVFDGTDTTSTPFPGNYLYFYGSWYPAPNSGGGAFSAVATGNATKDNVGSNYLNIYSDYNNRGAHEGGEVVNAIFAQQYTIGNDDIGKTLTFSFDAKRPDVEDDGFGGDSSLAVGNNCANPCTAQAFVKTLDPSSNYDTTNLIVEDTTSISQSAWSSFTLTLELTDPALAGQILQLGFESFATGDDSTGVYYDNLVLNLEQTTDPEVPTYAAPIPLVALLGFGALLGWAGMSSIRKRLS